MNSSTLFEELLWVHGMIRRDLDTVLALAREVNDGLPPDQVTEALETLQTRGPLWQLKVNCLHYCRFVHRHHGLEDIALFPALRRVDPELGPVVDRLEEDHRRVSHLLDALEHAEQQLAATDTAQTRERVTEALDVLAEHLLAHLELEEESIGPSLGLLR